VQLSHGFSESDIRPDHLMQAQAERFQNDVRRLLQHQDEFVQVSCPACGLPDAEKTFEKHGLTYVTCAGCRTMYVNPRPTPAILATYYATSENYAYWNKYIFPASEEARRTKIFRPRAQRIADIARRHGIHDGALLEVGAGFGTFCEEARNLGLFHRVIAVEPTPDLAETCRKKGLEVIQAPIEQIDLSGQMIDVIASFEVVEHLFAPKYFLESCASMLAPGGLLIVTCPNVQGFDILVLGKMSSAVDAEHLNYFHPSSLAHLVSTCGLETVEILTPGNLDAELVRKHLLSGELDGSAHPFLRQVLVDEWEQIGGRFQNFLAENMLSSHMWLVARKPG
jgi:2-polyprenyl-3-methyl-5-hydroxy-6-metoxy-1,4-benzoquinol methylase